MNILIHINTRVMQNQLSLNRGQKKKNTEKINMCNYKHTPTLTSGNK